MHLLRSENDGSQGEFSGGFGTTSNPATQIFKEGGFKGPNRTKWIIIIGAIIVAVAVGFYLYTSNPDNIDTLEKSIFEDAATPKAEEHTKQPESDKAPKDQAAPHKEMTEAKDPLNDTAKKDSFKEKDLSDDEDSEEAAEPKQDEKIAEEKAPNASAAPVLTSPEDKHSRFYDETSPSPEFTWQGTKGDMISFSRSPGMESVIEKVKTNGKSYIFRQPQPGTWYWRVSNSAGQSPIRSFTIKPPIRRNVQLISPVGGASLSGNGGIVTWTGDTKVTYYRVEFTTGDWSHPFKFATTGTQRDIQGLAPGNYQMRIGANSEVSGKIEYTEPVTVKVE